MFGDLQLCGVCDLSRDYTCLNYASIRVFLPFQSHCASIGVTWFGLPSTFVFCCDVLFSQAITYVVLMGTMLIMIIVAFVSEFAMCWVCTLRVVICWGSIFVLDLPIALKGCELGKS